MTRPSHSAARRTTVLGVLGGIASGKSAAARLLAGPQGLVVDADELAGEVLESPALRTRLIARFGPRAVDASGRIDRRHLASAVFADAAARAELEGWIHPAVRRAVREQVETLRARGAPRIVLDVPLLLENEAEHGLAAECDALVFVDCRDDLRDARARRSRGWPAGEVSRREAAQMPLEHKRARAAAVIANDGTLDELARAARLALSRLGLE